MLFILGAYSTSLAPGPIPHQHGYKTIHKYTQKSLSQNQLTFSSCMQLQSQVLPLSVTIRQHRAGSFLCVRVCGFKCVCIFCVFHVSSHSTVFVLVPRCLSFHVLHSHQPPNTVEFDHFTTQGPQKKKGNLQFRFSSVNKHSSRPSLVFLSVREYNEGRSQSTPAETFQVVPNERLFAV